MDRRVALVGLLAVAGCGGGSSRGGVATSIAPATSATSASSNSATAPTLAPVPGNGPRVVFDAAITLGDPAPSPFPNDTWTRPDATTVTGKRVALPLVPQTKLEAQLGEGINDLDGWGTYAPIMVTFDGPLDLATVTSASVMVVNCDPRHPRFGRSVALDLSPTHPVFPVKLKNPYAYLSSLEPNAGAEDIVFRHGNRVHFHEDETNTLLLRPVVPLDEAAEHAVVITTALKHPRQGRPVLQRRQARVRERPEHEDPGRSALHGRRPEADRGVPPHGANRRLVPHPPPLTATCSNPGHLP